MAPKYNWKNIADKKKGWLVVEQLGRILSKYVKAVLLFLIGGAVYLFGPKDGLWDAISGVCVVWAIMDIV